MTDRVEYGLARKYLYESVGFDAEFASRRIVQCVAQFASSYEVWPVGYPAAATCGPLPEGATNDRGIIVDSLWDEVKHWWEVHEPHMADYVMIGVVLRRDHTEVLDQDDGIPARLFLSTAELQQLMICLEQAGLPHDILEPQTMAFDA